MPFAALKVFHSCSESVSDLLAQTCAVALYRPLRRRSKISRWSVVGEQRLPVSCHARCSCCSSLSPAIASYVGLLMRLPIKAMAIIWDRHSPHCIMKRNKNAAAAGSPTKKPTSTEPSSDESIGTLPRSHDAISSSSPMQSESPPSHVKTNVGIGIGSAIVPASPQKNKAAFLASFTTSKIYTDLAVYQDSPGARYEFEGIITAVHPATAKPERRYIVVADAKGTTGLVLWNEKSNLVGFTSVGQVLQCTRVSLTSYNGKRSLTLGRDSTIRLSPADAEFAVNSPLAKWWQDLLSAAALNSESVQHVPDQTIVSVAGVVGAVTFAEKTVNGESKILVFVHIGDANGKFTLRSWNHRVADFEVYLDMPVMFRRVRVATYAGQKVGDIMECDATQIVTSFDGAATLASFWKQ